MQVERYLASLRRRAWAVLVLRAIVVATAAGGGAFVLLAQAVGPVVHPVAAGLAWVVVLLATALATVRGLRGMRALQGSGAARLLAARAPELVSAARTAAELQALEPARGASQQLAQAHAVRVEEALGAHPVAQVVPWSTLRTTSLSVALGVLAAAALGLSVSERAAAGAYALLHPGARDASGHAVAALSAGLSVRLVFPDYLAREPETLIDPERLEAPRGTTCEVRVRLRVDADDAVLEVPGAEVRLTRSADGAFEGRFRVMSEGLARLRVRQGEGAWLRDAAVRPVRVLLDAAPRVVLFAPDSDLVLEAQDTVEVLWEATDDHGVREAELVVRSARGRETRRRLYARSGEVDELLPGGSTTLLPSELGAEPGDAIVFWIEAKDGDDVSGPNVGKSVERTVQIASTDSRHAQNLAGLEKVLEAVLDTLADRLESRPVPDTELEARSRARTSIDSLRSLATALAETAAQLRRDPRAQRADTELLEGASSRIRARAAAEDRLHTRRLAPLAQRVSADAATQLELESDALLLSDLIGRARIEDAADIVRELEQLRQRMASLLEEARRTQSPEAREALLAEITRAEARMRELAERLARMQESVPSDFLNADAMDAPGAADALEQLREAVERGDLDRAAERLAQLAQRIDQLSGALGESGEELGEARFGERERAMAEAMDRLAGLEAEQGTLASESAELHRRVAERAGATSASAELLEQAAAARRALDALPRSDLETFTRESLDRARQRAADAEDSLRSGDLGEALEMSRAASEDAQGLARELSIEAQMFPGADGRNARAAREARQAARALEGVAQAIGEAMPSAGEHVDGADRASMQAQTPRQRRVRDAAGALGEQLGQGPDGTPLSPDGERAVREAADAMRRAEDALGRGDPQGAWRAQEEAHRRLADLREQMEQDQQRGGGGGGGGQESGGREGGDGMPDFRRPVRIPGADEFAGPEAERRRVLDAMRESPPGGFEDAVRAYYEELLR